MIRIVEAPGLPSHVALAVSPPSRAEVQLMRGMGDEEALLFLVHARRILLVPSRSPASEP